MIRSINRQMDDQLFDAYLASKGLLDMWNYIVETNAGKVNPYHNTQHMYYAAQLGLKILRACPQYLALDASDKHNEELIVVTSLLWHDYGHSGGTMSDAENIQIAIAGYINWRNNVRPYPVNFNPVMEHEQAHFMIEKVRETIEVTEFPFIHAPYNLAQRVVRDADLLYTFCDETGDILYGLYKELQPKLGDMSLTDFVKGQQNFHDNVTLFTDIGKSLHVKMTPVIINAQKDFAYRHALLNRNN